MNGQEENRGGAPGARRWRGWAAVLLAAVLVTGGGWGIHLACQRAPWLLPALTSRTNLFCLGLLAVCGAAFVLLAGALWQLGRPYRKQMGGQDGVAMIEFTLALPFLLMLALLMTQTALVMVGNLCVHYSAFCAARTAIVTIPKDFGTNEPRNNLKDSTEASGKLNRIKTAAAWAVMPISCGNKELTTASTTISQGVNAFFAARAPNVLLVSKWADANDGRLDRKFQYAMDHTEVTVTPPIITPNNDDDLYGQHEDIHVTVRHTVYLSIPYAARIFGALPGGVELNFGEGEFGTVVSATCTLPNEGVQDYVDIETFPQDAK
jgi:hypothetical protein